jgi:hypothetical protein
LHNADIKLRIDEHRDTREARLPCGERTMIGRNAMQAPRYRKFFPGLGQSTGEIDFQAVEREAR